MQTRLQKEKAAPQTYDPQAPTQVRETSDAASDRGGQASTNGRTHLDQGQPRK